MRVTSVYQKMICTSCGVLRKSSMYDEDSRDTNQFLDSRAMPMRTPRTVAPTTLKAEILSVLAMAAA